MQQLIGQSTSCGKYGRHGLTHCGRCVPCMVRRAAFMKAGIMDSTKNGYKFANLKTGGLTKGANDIGAMAMAYIKFKTFGLRTVIGGSLSFASTQELKNYEEVFERGLDEIGDLLKAYGVI